MSDFGAVARAKKCVFTSDFQAFVVLATNS
jgi:hypothetical protein